MKELLKRLRHQLRLLLNKKILIPRTYRWTSHLQILNDLESLRYVIDHRCSLSRFGDGEFNLIQGEGNGFQEPDQRLAERLSEILSLDTRKTERFMIGIPLPIKNLSNLRDPYVYWPYVAMRHLSLFKSHLHIEQTYLNASMTRFYFEKEDKSNCALQLAMLKRIWEGRKLMIVEGCETRSGVGNDLYDGALRVRRILCPAISAFNKYHDILSAIKENVENDELVLISLGMTATVLAYDLYRAGYQAIDLGHVDIEYEWFLAGHNERIAIKGKFVQENPEGRTVCDCTDPEYLSQIICDLS